MKTERVAVLYIGLGNYICLWKNFYISAERHFLLDTYKEYFVFTDSDEIYADEMENVHKIYQMNMGWPGNSMLRFSFFNSIKSRLLEYDYTFFMNANIFCNQLILEEEFLPREEDLLFVQHHGYYNKSNIEFPYERNPDSEAYIAYGEGNFYITGGINGGKSAEFLKLSEELAILIQKDIENGIVAVWHDESFINKYALKVSRYKLLSPSYFYPELLGSWALDFERKLIALDKRKYFDVLNLKIDKNEWQTDNGEKLENMKNGYYYKLCFKWLKLYALNISIIQFLETYNHVAIYSYSNIGELLINEIEQQRREELIACILDPNPEQYHGKYPVCKPFEFNSGDVDLIIITESYNYSEICASISMISDVPIISLEDIIIKLMLKNNLKINTKEW